LDPGSRTDARTGPFGCGAGQGSGMPRAAVSVIGARA